MTQFVDKSEDELKFWRIFNKVLSDTKVDITDYYETAYQSKALGEILYDQKLMPIYKTLEKSLFLKAFSEILEGEKTLGSYNAYLKILYAIFGKDAEITITKVSPAHIKIDIQAPIQVHYVWKVRKHPRVIVTNEGKYLVFKKILAEVTSRDLLQILKSTTKAGTYIEFTLNREDDE